MLTNKYLEIGNWAKLREEMTVKYIGKWYVWVSLREHVCMCARVLLCVCVRALVYMCLCVCVCLSVCPENTVKGLTLNTFTAYIAIY